ncbi:CDP-diacylglycerol--serine O-phosphatidyltransferase [Aestuariirhabdus sp. Z084]|uniref:CDP-diacylglycerol--serine O-phosphatidyltransferase n=1 Tax=Aestuariirhabdus haliotis TaxID=2918751 RepID=UPI00201B36C6|nr:CDP-diacylglycerol--serine O-phosphatidyltransferase [Aestuariirhabdus haliotis]MCL6417325.1 CDP-diacylglycerol--serine O-phosphatidyltransferase [Aestuariirhabdus haliotis]MCL6421270.1 CDP-diacylglycerol--serine O-phosphatidyltransferase [Aestuariirhabdus haliotis]
MVDKEKVTPLKGADEAAAEGSGDAVESLLPVDEHVEEVAENGQRVQHRGVYLLPNLFTTAALFCGFYAVIAATKGAFEPAAIAIFVAMVLDGLDGRVARLTNTQSAFGAEYDSLSDMVSFGVAPAVVAYSWALEGLGKLGWVVAFIYAAGAALRLARFNTQIETADKRFFTGLPSPAAAAVVAGMVWSFSAFSGEHSLWLSLLAMVVTASAGVMMVTNIRFHSFKDLDLKGRVPFVFILVVVLVFAVVAYDPPRVLWGVFVVYTLSGPLMAVMRWGDSSSKPEA